MKKQKGITLIALVITIIVLLILAGVAINTILSDDGVLQQAVDAKEKTDIAQEKEWVLLAAGAAKLNNVENVGKITEEHLEIELDKVIGKRDEAYTLTKDGTNFVVTYIESERSYIVEENGNLSTLENVEPSNIDEWEWEVDEVTQTATITVYKGTDTEVVVPNYIDGYKVIAIDPKGACGLWDQSICEGYAHSEVHYCQRTITKVTVSRGIETVGDSAFHYSFALEEIVFEEGVKVIESNMVGSSNSELTNFKKVYLPNGIVEIKDRAFYGAYYMEEVFIPKNVSIIGNNAFSYSTKLKYEGTEEEWENLNYESYYEPNVEFNCTR